MTNHATGTFEIKTFPAKKVKFVATRTGSVLVPDPLECSGAIYSSRNGLQQVADCECCECWVTRYDEAPVLSDQEVISDGSLQKRIITFIPASRRFFFKKFHVKVEQMSVSETVYNFWKSVAKQSEGNRILAKKNSSV